MIDKTLIIRKIALISEDFEVLKPLAQLGYEDYVAESTNEVLAERYLERMIGRMIDINYHLITEEGHKPPSDYFQSFLKLADIGVLPRDFVEQIAPCAGLRNRIVHEYDEIDCKKVYEGLQVAMRDIPRYLKLVSDFIEKV
ncbi:HepT-like ribonuclease domain-containing protein [Candidatus Oleimmundimicrobium sp.]|uniref:type VII toxin-antitoxin system HepT family RNase toxin n=1 Tax=Candidatus Oleimmundimicrobium sp. TaxID=3060597 RepID=UPI002717D3FE|nr:HepT-like ribonuclease domain-containing protein [Candidatus Oleimmundimicrobium sp.]MDO8886407.1 DUF86 domain-containing protein [Candidatus Oleimmundimicrobium sp.]